MGATDYYQIIALNTEVRSRFIGSASDLSHSLETVLESISTFSFRLFSNLINALSRVLVSEKAILNSIYLTFDVLMKKEVLPDLDFLGTFKNNVWLLGTACWLFGITDRTIASFTDSYLSAIDLMQLFTASFFFVSWLYLKPEKQGNDPSKV